MTGVSMHRSSLSNQQTTSSGLALRRPCRVCVSQYLKTRQQSEKLTCSPNRLSPGKSTASPWTKDLRRCTTAVTLTYPFRRLTAGLTAIPSDFWRMTDPVIRSTVPHGPKQDPSSHPPMETMALGITGNSPWSPYTTVSLNFRERGVKFGLTFISLFNFPASSRAQTIPKSGMFSMRRQTRRERVMEVVTPCYRSWTGPLMERLTLGKRLPSIPCSRVPQGSERPFWRSLWLDN